MMYYYEALLDTFSLRTILTSLARQSDGLASRGLEKLKSSREILKRILLDPQLSLTKDYISWTTKLSEFKEKKRLKSYSKVEEKPGL